MNLFVGVFTIVGFAVSALWWFMFCIRGCPLCLNVALVLDVVLWSCSLLCVVAFVLLCLVVFLDPVLLILLCLCLLCAMCSRVIWCCSVSVCVVM